MKWWYYQSITHHKYIRVNTPVCLSLQSTTPGSPSRILSISVCLFVRDSVVNAWDILDLFDRRIGEDRASIIYAANYDTIDILASISQAWLYDGEFMNEVSFNEKPALLLVFNRLLSWLMIQLCCFCEEIYVHGLSRAAYHESPRRRLHFLSSS